MNNLVQLPIVSIALRPLCPSRHMDRIKAHTVGETYYWRIDEVHAQPGVSIHRGIVWDFTTESFSYPIENVSATASRSSVAHTGPEKTIDGSGLDSMDQHSTLGTDMWLSQEAGPQPTWIQYELDQIYTLHQIWVWNSNQAIESFIGLGAKDVAIETSLDAETLPWIKSSCDSSIKDIPSNTRRRRLRLWFRSIEADQIHNALESQIRGFISCTVLIFPKRCCI